ncbi:hypothetical protein VNO77_04478 [Canavalia gladiata]|uniref:Uncharacterized protein n=1 Tax=Canavalia gladiata TaxID=3824 RepID=A0AAN9MX88_CANGL
MRARFPDELNDKQLESGNNEEEKEVFNADAWGRRRSRPDCSCQGGHGRYTPDGTRTTHWCSELTRAPHVVIGARGAEAEPWEPGIGKGVQGGIRFKGGGFSSG